MRFPAPRQDDPRPRPMSDHLSHLSVSRRGPPALEHGPLTTDRQAGAGTAVAGNPLHVRFDRSRLTSNGGMLLLARSNNGTILRRSDPYPISASCRQLPPGGPRHADHIGPERAEQLPLPPTIVVPFARPALVVPVPPPSPAPLPASPR
jgi:hypothetical protein